MKNLISFVLILTLSSCGINKADMNKRIEAAKKGEAVKWMNWYADKLGKQKAIYDDCQAKIVAAKSQSQVSELSAKALFDVESMWKEPDCPTCESVLSK